jgi:glyoxylase-like metal-dependent hydrolase (beta-lactamase superfamily II)
MNSSGNGSSNTFYFEVARDVWGMRDVFVNIYMIRNADDNTWVLIDAGLKSSGHKIRKMAKQLFGETPPAAIILTHGHFDHVGSIGKLSSEWKVPVYAHYMELPYLMGKSSYPPPDPTVGGGMMAWVAKVYPNSPINIESIVTVLPEDGVVPFLNEWKYLHTPGHAPGHISLFRETDRLLIAGDAFVTTKQESAIAVFLQTEKVSRPPAYFTYDWDAAYQSVEKLAMLNPQTVATGHGKPMSGEEMRQELHQLYVNFYEEAVPATGRYIDDPAVVNASGVIYLPSRQQQGSRLNWWAIGSAIVLSAAVIALLAAKKKKKWYELR